MTEFDRQAALNAALRAAGAGSAELMRRFRSPAGELQAWHKAPGAPVTDADLASDRAIAGVLQAGGVPAGILSEESETAGQNSPLTWLIDPLCGTLPYRDGLAHWGINIALRDGASLELGAVAVPTAREVLVALRGSGVSRNGERYEPAPPRVPLAHAVVCAEIDSGEWQHHGNNLARWASSAGIINMFSSIAYPGIQLLLGRIAALVVYNVGPVHVAATAAIALELGLRVTDDAGHDLDWSRDDNHPGVVIGWPEHHAKLLDEMRQTLL